MKFRTIELSDLPQASELFRQCLSDLINREDIDDPLLKQNETDRLIDLMQTSLDQSSNNFFVAEENGAVLGTIALLPPGDIIKGNLHCDEKIPEVSCVYVHPARQKSGVGSFLFANILTELKKSGSYSFYLDAGFSSSQQYWLSKLGPETHLLRDYWGPGQHHRIWERKVESNQ